MAAVRDFDEFAGEARPRLVRAFVATRGVHGAADAAAEALAYGWEHWERVGAMENPIGYLYRVGRSRTRARRAVALPPPATVGLPDVERRGAARRRRRGGGRRVRGGRRPARGAGVRRRVVGGRVPRHRRRRRGGVRPRLPRPGDRTWHLLAPGPLPARTGARAVAHGEELFVWGGEVCEQRCGTGQDVAGGLAGTGLVWRR